MSTTKRLDDVAANQKTYLWRDRVASLALAVLVVLGYGVVENAAQTLLETPVTDAVAAISAELPATRNA